MNRFRILVASALFTFALAAFAQAPATAVPDVDQHMTMLTEKLALTSDQQAKIRPILAEMLDARSKIMQDESMSPDERSERAKAEFYKADRKVRVTLTDDQKKKLDDVEREMHHGH